MSRRKKIAALLAIALCAAVFLWMKAPTQPPADPEEASASAPRPEALAKATIQKPTQAPLPAEAPAQNSAPPAQDGTAQ